MPLHWKLLQLPVQGVLIFLGVSSLMKSRRVLLIVGVSLLLAFAYVGLGVHRAKIVEQSRAAIDARIFSLVEQADAWAGELEANKKVSSFEKACAGKLQPGTLSSAIGYTAALPKSLVSAAGSVYFPKRGFVIPRLYSGPETLKIEKIPPREAFPGLLVDVLLAPFKWRDSIRRRGPWWIPPLPDDLSYLVLSLGRAFRFPEFAGYSNAKEATGKQRGQGAFVDLRLGVYDVRAKTLVCAGSARVNMPQAFFTVGFGKTDEEAKRDANLAKKVSISAIAALTLEFERFGLRKICGQVSPELCMGLAPG